MFTVCDEEPLLLQLLDLNADRRDQPRSRLRRPLTAAPGLHETSYAKFDGEGRQTLRFFRADA